MTYAINSKGEFGIYMFNTYNNPIPLNPSFDDVKLWITYNSRRFVNYRAKKFLKEFKYDKNRASDEDVAKIRHKLIFQLVQDLPFVVDIQNAELLRCVLVNIARRVDWWLDNFELDYKELRRRK